MRWCGGVRSRWSPALVSTVRYTRFMSDWESELTLTVAKITAARALDASRVQYRDRQIREALAQGATWAQLQRITGLSPRGLALAIKRV